MVGQRPHAITANDQLLGLILDEMEEQGEVLRRILDRLPEPTAAGQPDPEPGPVEVSEPAPKRRPDKQAEPESEPEPAAVPVSEPARKTAPAKKASAARRRH